MSVEDIANLSVGDRVRFKTKAVHDNVYWTGTVTAICGYDIARQFGGANVDIYHSDVKRVDSTVGDIESLTFFIIKTTMANGTVVSNVFAKEWVDASTFEYVESTEYRDIRIYGVDNSKANDILSFIQTLYPEYVAKLL